MTTEAAHTFRSLALYSLRGIGIACLFIGVHSVIDVLTTLVPTMIHAWRDGLGPAWLNAGSYIVATCLVAAKWLIFAIFIAVYSRRMAAWMCPSTP